METTARPGSLADWRAAAAAQITSLIALGCRVSLLRVSSIYTLWHRITCLVSEIYGCPRRLGAIRAFSFLPPCADYLRIGQPYFGFNSLILLIFLPCVWLLFRCMYFKGRCSATLKCAFRPCKVRLSLLLSKEWQLKTKNKEGCRTYRKWCLAYLYSPMSICLSLWSMPVSMLSYAGVFLFLECRA